ncbi:dihydrofolate reductase [Emticicia sp. CRIBPO]|uniref:dihydrofolate reductase family protein n=1 Tax=Emticicia sp. CRIBPO TaxID=2683258 RepID=UPI0014134D67|nr:dihydrofolate reductase family protein [Emticicia sp. CRIBPO]NBA88312.1 dihydrofolate reductase [Emticicia sp. CRIBPO]
MKKVIAAINMTLDGFCDHTSGVPDEEVHQHYADLLRSAGIVLYGRITYQLMEYWRTVLENPTGDKAMDDFAAAIDNTPKLVFSRTLKNVDWQSAELASQGLEEEISALKQSDGDKDIFVCSPSLIVASTKLNLIDEYQLCVHPVIAGSGLTLFKDISEKITLKLTNTRTFGGGAVILYYEAGNSR